MLRCRIIADKTPRSLEESVNRWFINNTHSIVSQSLTFDPISENHFVISIFYDDGKYEYSNSDSVPQSG